MLVDLFIPCFIDQFYPETAYNTVKILRKAGVKIQYNKNQTCCGQPAFNSGFWDESLAAAIKFFKDFPSDRPIVCPSGSCAGFIKKHYGKLSKDNEFQNEYLRVKNNLFELTDFLVNHLKITDLGSTFKGTVTYHDSCSALREYGIKEEPRTLLKNIKNVTLVEMKESETCCGFGGTFAAKYESISVAMVQQKVDNALKTNAQYIATTEASCLMNINGYIEKNKLPIKALHIADILAFDE